MIEDNRIDVVTKRPIETDNFNFDKWLEKIEVEVKNHPHSDVLVKGSSGSGSCFRHINSTIEFD